MVKIAPSILSADFANLEKEIKALEKAGADMIHIDVMDGHFVPNITMGPGIVKAMRVHTKLPFDVHLMISKPEEFIDAFADSGADIITIHYEASLHIDRTLTQIRNLGKMAGISLLPSTPPEVLDYLLDKIDLILVMTVNPGFGGQKFMESQIKKIQILAEKIKDFGKPISLAVDGGINESTAFKCKAAGADTLVAGSFIFQNEDYANAINLLK